jgi:hypothetical protein
MIVCGFYTNDRYRELAAKMKASVVGFGYEVALYKRPHHPDPETAWGMALLHKSQIIRQAMIDFPKEDILYLDADCEMVARPDMLLRSDGDFDIAWSWIRPKHPHGCSSFYRATPAARAFLDRWCASPEEFPHIRLDEIHQFFALRHQQERGLVRFKTLPPAYAWVPFSMGKQFPGAKPIIVHHGLGRGPDKADVLREAAFHLPV